ncbi:MAG TPA: hypothetical protein VHZ95_17490, partial [Polyangiales bacterium]|nr:hypothetical protein [Polyangiales bacterium]
MCTYNETERDLNPGLKPFVTSLSAHGDATVHQLESLAPAAIDELLSRTFGVGASARSEFAALLYGWTRGNPFFIEETLKALVASRRIYQRGGEWFGWEVSNLGLPRSIRDAVATRLGQLSPEARKTAELMSVIGTRAGYGSLRLLQDTNDADLLAALDDLRRNAIVTESEEGGEAVFDFTHPIVRDTLYAELGVARAKVLHAAIAEGLEKRYGARAAEHADQLAYHYARADARQLVPKALAYLTRAGRHALAQYANREAADYLAAALEQGERLRAELGTAADYSIVEDLAQARQRLGEYDVAQSLWETALNVAKAANDGAGDLPRIADIERRAGLAAHWAGRHEAALAHYDVGLDAATRADERMRTAKLRLAKSACFHALGDSAAADREIEAAELLARDAGDDALLARVYRAQLLTHLWTGSPEHALREGTRVLELATQTGEQYLAFTAHWALAMVSGLTGNSKSLEHHLIEGEKLAEQLRSPVLGLWIAEIVIQFRFGIGQWDNAIAEGERAIALARLLGQRVIVPRLLVWTAVVYMARGDVAKAQAYAAEAWTLGGPRSDSGEHDVHSLLAVHMGRAYCHLGADEYEDAVRISEAGLVLADRVGYVVWAVYQLVPIAAEACLRLAATGNSAEFIARARAYTTRLRRDSSRSGQRLGLAWADAGDGVIARLRGDNLLAIELFTRAIDALEAVPYVHDGAR